MREEIEKLVNKTMLSKNRKAELIESLLVLYNVRLSFFQPENCPEWIEGVGDCKKPDCTFCKIEAEIEGNEA